MNNFPGLATQGCSTSAGPLFIIGSAGASDSLSKLVLHQYLSNVETALSSPGQRSYRLLVNVASAIEWVFAPTHTNNTVVCVLAFVHSVLY